MKVLDYAQVIVEMIVATKSALANILAQAVEAVWTNTVSTIVLVPINVEFLFISSLDIPIKECTPFFSLYIHVAENDLIGCRKHI